MSERTKGEYKPENIKGEREEVYERERERKGVCERGRGVRDRIIMAVSKLLQYNRPNPPF